MNYVRNIDIIRGQEGGDSLEKITMIAARVNAGIKQTEMAKRLGKSVNTVCDWEKGRKSPRMDEFEAYCKECGMNIEDVRC